MPAPPDFPSPDPTGPGTPKKVRGPGPARHVDLIMRQHGWYADDYGDRGLTELL